MRQRHHILLLLLLLLGGCSCCPRENIQIGMPPSERSGCIGEELFVDASGRTNFVCSTFPYALSARLDEVLNEKLCRPDFHDCDSNSRINVRLEPVFTDARVDASGCDISGRERFFRLRLVDSNSTPIVIRAEHACFVNQLVRAEALSVHEGLMTSAQCQVEWNNQQACVINTRQTEFEVGRECPAQVLDSTHYAAPDLVLSSHAAYANDLRFPSLLNRPATPLIDVALVDTGVSEAAVTTSGGRITRVEGAWPEDDQSERPLPHGTAMALLITQASKNAAVRSYRAWDEDGRGRTKFVARAIAHAARTTTGPLVINLSLGWPPDLAWRVPRAIPGSNDVCEGVAVEAVKFALLHARRRVEPTIVVAAAGNRPAGLGLETVRICSSPAEPCIEANLSHALFYPAEWANDVTAFNFTGDRGKMSSLALPVGSVDENNRLSAMTRRPIQPGSSIEPRFKVAWRGERVYVAGRTGLPESMPGAWCGTGTTVPTPALSYPTVVSGTSASAAQVSAFIASTQAAQIHRYGASNALSWRQMQWVIENVGANVVDSTLVRAPDACTADRFLWSCRPEILSISSTSTDYPSSMPLPLPSCSGGGSLSCLIARGGTPNLMARAAAIASTPSNDPLGRPGAGPTLAYGRESHDLPSCTATVAVATPTQSSEGRYTHALTPQPIIIGCPECPASWYQASGEPVKVEVWGQIGGPYWENVVLKEPIVRFYASSGTLLASFALTGEYGLSPGQTFHIVAEGMPEPHPDVVQADLQLKMFIDGVYKDVAVAPLRYVAQPPN